MKRGEGVRDIADTLLAIKRQVMQTTEHLISNSDFVDAFLDGLPNEISEFVGSQIDEQTNPDVVIQQCINCEEWLRRTRQGHRHRASKALATRDQASDNASDNDSDT